MIVTEVSRGQCIHASQKVVKHYIGDPLKEFARLEDYIEELKKSNPGSTIVMEEEGGVFKRMYVCFAGVRKRFNEACRKIIGLDGCFLKGPFKGVILSAVGKDPNDQIYPIAWAVVGYECKETWKWFLELFMMDLDVAGGNFVYAADGAPVIARGEGFTFISDQQKGLILAISELMPAAVHRRCARYIFAKWMKDHSSDELHQQFWKICKSSTKSEFLDELEVLKDITCFVSNWYSKQMFELAYKYPILPVQGMKFWPRVAVTTIKPPSFNKSTSTSNPASKHFTNASSSQDVLPPPAQMQPTSMSASQVSTSQVQASQASDRTQHLLQELRQECGTAQPAKRRKKN